VEKICGQLTQHHRSVRLSRKASASRKFEKLGRSDFGRKQMKSIGPRLQEMAGFGTSSSQDDQALPAFDELAMPLFDSLYNFARWLVHNSNDAEDLVQETYLKALRSFASFRSGTNFRAWIFQILRNTFLSSCSKLEQRMTVVMDSEEDFPEFSTTSATPESLLIQHSGNDAVRCAIEQLPVIFREVILLCDVEDASYREIAEILSIPIGTVMSRLARARKAVRESLLSTSDASLSRNLSHHSETHDEDSGAHREIASEGSIKTSLSLAKVAFPVGWSHKRASNLR
jgi:RNA polymerase sigma factor (sigma-70 family)